MSTGSTHERTGLDGAGLVRVAAAVASLGAGLIALAVASPAARGDAGPLATPVAAAAGLLGLWQLGWALAALRAPDLPAPRAATAVALLAALGWLAAAAVLGAGASGGRTSALLAAPLAAVAASGTALGARWAARPGPVEPLAPVAQLAALLVICFGAAALVTPALAASPAGHSSGAHGMAGM